jgi:hypothetical protein
MNKKTLRLLCLYIPSGITNEITSLLLLLLLPPNVTPKRTFLFPLTLRHIFRDKQQLKKHRHHSQWR